MSGMMRRHRQAVDWKEIQDCKSQKGWYSGVHTHHDLRGAGTPEHLLHYCTARAMVSNQVDSVYSSINKASQIVVNSYFC